MNTEKIKFRRTATAHGDCYRAKFAGCDLELSLDRETLQIIDLNSEHETWVKDARFAGWEFTETSNENALPTAGWPEIYFKFVEDAIAALAEKD